MSFSWKVEWRGGLYLPQCDFWLDAPSPVARGFISHAHSDHMARHAAVLCSEPTARLMQARLGGKREVTALPWGQDHMLDEATRVRLHPAGHILGSAQFLAVRDGQRLLYTGDFKLRPGLSSETCATPRAETLIMECTFGLPRYVFPPLEEVQRGIIQFCREAIADRAVPVLLAYSLGKSQEVLCCLKAAGLPVMLHPQVLKMTRVCEALGQTFPAYQALDWDAAAGHVVIGPPQSAGAEWLQRLTPRRTAMVTGWALDSRAKYQYRTDRAFALSDHADFPDLLKFVELVQPREVLLVHGWTREFAQTLRSRGVNAWALGRENQLELGF